VELAEDAERGRAGGFTGRAAGWSPQPMDQVVEAVGHTQAAGDWPGADPVIADNYVT